MPKLHTREGARARQDGPFTTFLFAPDQCHPLELGGMLEALDEANRIVQRQVYALSVVGESDGPITCSTGLKILPDRSLAHAPTEVDTLIVVASHGIPSEPSDLV